MQIEDIFFNLRKQALMIKRRLARKAKELFTQYPVITITGPRQSGKTTLAKNTFPRLKYFNLEDIETRTFAREDPKGFLKGCAGGAILDEIQNAPDLLSSIQVYVDSLNREGLFVLTGSRQLELMESVSQSLAGRTALLKLLPFSIEELHEHGNILESDEYLYHGFYPRIHDKKLNPSEALADYYTTYVERDLRQLANIHNLHLFHTFVKHCAGRVGQLINLSSLASDTGISHTTAQDWLTLLEASYIIFRLQPYFANIGKRLIKSPKLYFYDVGLAAHLLGIESIQHVAHHPLKGNLYENMAISEILKYRFNRNKTNNLFFFRDARGREVDCLYTISHKIYPIEIKSSRTFNRDFLTSIEYFMDAIHESERGFLVYDGEGDIDIRNITLLSPRSIWEKLDALG